MRQAKNKERLKMARLSDDPRISQAVENVDEMRKVNKNDNRIKGSKYPSNHLVIQN